MSKGKKDMLHPDVSYLMEPKITDVIGQGLAVLYQEKPQRPVEYLAKWLLVHSAAEKERMALEVKIKQASDLRIKHQFLLGEEEKKRKEEERKQKEKEEEIRSFKTKLEKSPNIPYEFQDLCNFLKEKVHATGVYLGKLEKKKKKIDDESNDKAHIDENEPDIIHYIAANEDHKFMVDQVVKADESYTHSWFTKGASETAPPPAQADPEAKEVAKSEPAAEPEIKKDTSIQLQELAEVTKEPKIKFFRVPRLGSYIAFAITHSSCLHEDILDKTMEIYMDLQKKVADQEKVKKEKEDEIQREKEEKEAAGEEYVPPPKVEWEKFPEPPYQTKNEKYYLCMDTLGQDREFTAEEKGFVQDVVKHMLQCWKESDTMKLTKDKELRAALKQKAEEYKEKTLVEINESIEQAAEEVRNDEKNAEIKEEDKELLAQSVRLQTLVKHLGTGVLKNELIELTNYTLLKYTRVFQYALYLLGYNREEICELDTNKMDWVKVKPIIKGEFLDKVAKYTPFGQKTEVFPKYRILNTIEKNLEEVKDEEVSAYSFSQGQLLRWIREAIKIRKLDMATRRTKRQVAKEEREKKLKEKEEWEKSRQEEVQAVKKDAEAKYQTMVEELKKAKEEVDEFATNEEKEKPIPEFVYNEAELMMEWNEKNPAIEVPPEVSEELDNDFIYEPPPPA